MFPPITNTSRRFKSVVLIVIISVLVIMYVIFSITSIDAWRAFVKLPPIRGEVETIQLDSEAKLPPINRK